MVREINAWLMARLILCKWMKRHELVHCYYFLFGHFSKTIMIIEQYIHLCLYFYRVLAESVSLFFCKYRVSCLYPNPCPNLYLCLCFLDHSSCRLLKYNHEFSLKCILLSWLVISPISYIWQRTFMINLSIYHFFLGRGELFLLHLAHLNVRFTLCYFEAVNIVMHFYLELQVPWPEMVTP